VGVLRVSVRGFLHRKGLLRCRLFDPNGRRLPAADPGGAALPTG
jgi:hypothetical protein